jgi:hypothetical protein
MTQLNEVVLEARKTKLLIVFQDKPYGQKKEKAEPKRKMHVATFHCESSKILIG